MAATFDDGILKIYSVENASKPGKKPEESLHHKLSSYFGFEKVGLTRYYKAKGADDQADESVHIYQDRSISTKDICVLEDGLQYKILQAQHQEDDDGIRITVLSLERIGKKYAITDS